MTESCSTSGNAIDLMVKIVTNANGTLNARIQKRKAIINKNGGPVKKMSEKYHVNITGIPSLKDVEEAISWLINVYCSVESFILIKKEIDNLTATYNTGYKIRLDDAVKLFSGARYNIERFPGACVKYNCATIIIFASGKVNILGKNSMLEIGEICRMLQTKLCHVAIRQ